MLKELFDRNYYNWCMIWGKNPYDRATHEEWTFEIEKYIEPTYTEGDDYVEKENI